MCRPGLHNQRDRTREGDEEPQNYRNYRAKPAQSCVLPESSVAYRACRIFACLAGFSRPFNEVAPNSPPLRMDSRANSGYTFRKAARVRRRPPQVRCVFSLDSGSLNLDVPPSEISRWRAVARVLRSPLDALSCALLPDLCSLCGSPLPQLSSAPICELCWTEFPVLLEPSCARCGDALTTPSSSTSDLCRVCRLAPPPFVRAVAYGIYEKRMRGALHAFK